MLEQVGVLDAAQISSADEARLTVQLDNALSRARNRFRIDQNHIVPEQSPIVINKRNVIARVEIERFHLAVHDAVPAAVLLSSFFYQVNQV